MTFTRVLLAMLFALPYLIMGQVPVKGLGDNPVYFIDSVKFSADAISKVNPNTVTLVTVISRDEAVKKFGSNAQDGIVYVETIDFVKRRCKLPRKSAI